MFPTGMWATRRAVLDELMVQYRSIEAAERKIRRRDIGEYPPCKVGCMASLMVSRCRARPRVVLLTYAADVLPAWTSPEGPLTVR